MAKIFSTDDPGIVRLHFSDTTTAFDGIKRAVLNGKGISCCTVCKSLFMALEKGGVPTYFIKEEGPRDLLCRSTEEIPLKFTIRHRVMGSTKRILGLEEGTRLNNSLYEIRYLKDSLCFPLVNDHHVVALGLMSYGELGYIHELMRKADTILTSLFEKAGIELVDAKLMFGKTAEGEWVICDEISPDNCRLWDIETGERLDKDRFRLDMSDVCAKYQEVKDRLLNQMEL